MIEPIAAVPAVAEPEIAAKIMDASTATIARLPFTKPIDALAKSTIRLDIPP